MLFFIKKKKKKGWAGSWQYPVQASKLIFCILSLKFSPHVPPVKCVQWLVVGPGLI